MGVGDSDHVSPLLGRLQRVDPRLVWEHEERHFTPWLLEHAEQLGEALGIDLELDAAEHPVGPFQLDLVGRDLTNGRVLIVENQLAGTDHRHLGQLLTYAGGTDASTIVWIAAHFEEQHRQAIDWLNERTDEETHFFAVELEVLRIDDSVPAPHFKLAAAPNDWQKSVRMAARGTRSTPTGKAAVYAEFWARLMARVVADRPSWTQRRELTRNAESWVGFPSGVSGARLLMSFAGRPSRLRHELYFQGRSPEENQAAYEAVATERAALEEGYGATLAFEPLGVTARIADYGPEGDVAEGQRHDEFIDWFISSGDRWRRAIAAIS